MDPVWCTCRGAWIFAPHKISRLRTPAEWKVYCRYWRVSQPLRFPDISLTNQLRYHVPAHIQEHIDYITPGIKLFTVGGSKHTLKPKTEELGERSLKINKRGFKLPIFLKGIADWILGGIERDLDLRLCDVAITPPCIASKFLNSVCATCRI